MQIATEGGKYLGGSIGPKIFQQAFVANEVDEWMKELEALIHIAQSRPHAAYATFTHRKWNNVLCYQFRRIKVKSLFFAATGIRYQDSIFPLSNWSKSTISGAACTTTTTKLGRSKPD